MCLPIHGLARRSHVPLLRQVLDEIDPLFLLAFLLHLIIFMRRGRIMLFGLMVAIGLFQRLVRRTNHNFQKVLGAIDQRKDEVDLVFDVFVVLEFDFAFDGFVVGKLKN